MTITAQLPSLEAMEQMIAMGMEERMARALDPIGNRLMAGSSA